MQPNVDMMNQFAQNGLEAAKQLGEINLGIWEKLVQHQVETVGSCLEAGSKNLELFGQAKGYQELVAAQAKLFQECTQKWLEGFRETAEIFGEARQAVADMAEEGMKTATDNLRKAAPAKKAA